MSYSAQVNRLALALIKPLLPAASAGVVTVTTIGGNSENPGHYPLPFPAMGPDFSAKQFIGQQVRHLMGDGLLDKVLTVFLKQRFIKAKLTFIDPCLARCFSGEIQSNIGFFKGLLKKGFSFLVKLKNPLFNLVKVVRQLSVCSLCLPGNHSGIW